jgi:hypothetical protein
MNNERELNRIAALKEMVGEDMWIRNAEWSER